MSSHRNIRQIMQNKELASLGDAFINFVYSLALSKSCGKPKAVKVSDRILADAFRLADLRKHLGTRVSRKDLANASESILFEAYDNGLLTIEESVEKITNNPSGIDVGLSELLKVAAERLAQN